MCHIVCTVFDFASDDVGFQYLMIVYTVWSREKDTIFSYLIAVHCAHGLILIALYGNREVLSNFFFLKIRRF